MARRAGIMAGVVAAAFCAGLFVGESRGLQAQTKNRLAAEIADLKVCTTPA